MERLIDEMKKDMTLQLYSPRTIKSYMRHIQDFRNYFDHSVNDLNENDIREYLYFIKEDKHYSPAYLSQAFSAIKYLYRETLKMPLTLTKLRGPKRVCRLPVVLSCEEVKALLNVVKNKKHRLVLMTTYSAGLRISEATHLKVHDIDSSRMRIRVVQGKGRKDRYTLLSALLLTRLREYWRFYKPQDWLFPGRDPWKPLNTSTVGRIFRDAKEKAGINKPATMHTLRHSFATHLLEKGVGIFQIQRLLGHAHIQTTMIYFHVMEDHQPTIVSPLDHMM